MVHCSRRATKNPSGAGEWLRVDEDVVEQYPDDEALRESLQPHPCGSSTVCALCPCKASVGNPVHTVIHAVHTFWVVFLGGHAAIPKSWVDS